ncbi:metal-sensitive transcriptional regulator [Streptosporangium sp. LJ11]|uniref:metal-sensitive transcriptional regulator n=1 Tax=Streptosporangium sp. LJ11 TaxID=3436927 RepID=UPI003F7927CC
MTETRGYVKDKDAYLRRLRRIEGQVRGLQRMVADETYCIDILTQVAAATRALQAVALGLLQDHITRCVADAVGGYAAAEGDHGDAEASRAKDLLVKDAVQAITRLVRS